MSVPEELLCSVEFLEPLDSSALKNHIKKGQSIKERNAEQSQMIFIVPHQLPMNNVACVTSGSIIFKRALFSVEILLNPPSEERK